MRFTISTAITLSAVLAFSQAAVGSDAVALNGTELNGAELFDGNCKVCHATEGRPTVAPPIFAVKNHVTGTHPEKDAFIEYIVNWVKAPNADSSLMPGAVMKFGLMPAQPNLNDEQLQAIAAFLYGVDMQLPEWYRMHYEEEHGEKLK